MIKLICASNSNRDMLLALKLNACKNYKKKYEYVPHMNLTA